MPSLRLWACLICLVSVSGQGLRPVDMDLKKEEGGMFQPGMFRGGVWKKVGGQTIFLSTTT